MTLINATVVQTIYNMVDFGNNSEQALIALAAAMVAIVVWAVLAWWFGIPTSESHALLAGITGAAISLNKGFSCINLNEWIKVLYGLILFHSNLLNSFILLIFLFFISIPNLLIK